MKQAVSKYDKMMNTPIPRLVAGLSVPTIISMMVTNVYNVVDTAFVGTLGTSASGAVGIVFGYMAILQAIGFTFGQGAGSIISRALGAKNMKKASQIASTALFYSFTIAIAAAVISGILLDQLIWLLGSTTTIAPFAKTYIFYILLTAPFMVSGFTLNNILRYEGRALYGMIGLMTGAGLNILGDAILMLGFHMGIAGAGLSTAVSQVVSFCILLAPFLRGRTDCRMNLKLVQFRPGEVLNIAATGAPSLLRQGLNSVTTILLNSEASVYGDAAVAAMSIVSRLFFFIFSIAIGVGQGFQPVSGFSYGAKRFDRLKKAYWFTIGLAQVLMILCCLAVYPNAEFFCRLLRDDPAVTVIAARALRLQCLAVLFLPFCMGTEMMMQSTGQRVSASILSCLRNGLIFIPLLLCMSSLRGLSGIQEAQPLSYVLAVPPAVLIAVLFFRKLRRTTQETA